MKTIIIHLVAFWNVAVMNCIQPVNWKYCYRVDQWLVPEVIEGIKIYTGETHPYQMEKKYLQRVNSNSNGHITQ
jgi:hypothetical protein